MLAQYWDLHVAFIQWQWVVRLLPLGKEKNQSPLPRVWM